MQGYAGAVLNDSVEYNEDEKTVDVILNIDRGPRFYINNLQLNLIDNVQTRKHTLNFISHEVENSYLPFLQGKRFSKERVLQTIESIDQFLKKRGYLKSNITWDSRVDRDTHVVDLDFTITLEKKKQTLFEGNMFLSEAFIETVIFQDVDIEDLPTTIIEQELEQAYKKRGFWKIQIEEQLDSGQRIFVIHEGARAFIKDIAIKGLNYASHKYLTRKFFSFVKRYPYDEAAIKNSIDSLINWYLRAGFWDVVLIKEEFIPLEHKEDYRLRLIIQEGSQRFLRSVSIKGHKKIETLWPFSHKQDIPFDMQILRDQKRWLLDYFYKKGNYNVTIEPSLQPDDTFRVDVVWLVTVHDENIRFGKTILQAVGRLPYSRIMRELCYKEGELWDRKKLEQSIKRLRNLEIFESVSCNPLLKNYEQSNERPVMVKVIETDPFEVRARVGFEKMSQSLTIEQGSTYKVGGSVIWRNPANQADILRFDADVTRFERTVCVSYHLPWIFNQPIDTLIKIYTNKATQPLVSNSNISLYDATNEGCSATFSYAGAHTVVGLNLGFHWSGFFETFLTKNRLSSVLDIDNNLLNTKLSYALIEPHLSFDYLDDSSNPTSGFRTHFSCKGMLTLDKGSSLGKFSFEHIAFKSWGPVVAGLHFGIGHIFNAPYHEIVPSERFFLGGPRILRGYELNSAPPLGRLNLPLQQGSGNKSFCQYVPQGGKSMAYGSLECRFPIVSLLSGVFFQDIGYLSKGYFDPTSDRLLASSGCGVRLNTRIGLLRFDVGWKWKKRHPQDKSYAWILTIGHAF